MTRKFLMLGKHDNFFVVPYKYLHLEKNGSMMLYYKPGHYPFSDCDCPVINVYDRMENGEWRLTETVQGSNYVVIDGIVYLCWLESCGRKDKYHSVLLSICWTRKSAPENVHRVYEPAPDGKM